MMNIADMTSAEINAVIFDGAAVDEPVTMSDEMALAIIEHPDWKHLDRALKDWAMNSIDLDALADGFEPE